MLQPVRAEALTKGESALPWLPLAERVAQWIDEADMVLVGLGSGMSEADGYGHYRWHPYFSDALAPFREKYGFTSPFAGFYHLFSDYESQWGYYSAYTLAMLEAPLGDAYRNLAHILDGKDCFVITSNVDGLARRAFHKDGVHAFQGDFGYLQCGQPCADELHESAPRVREMMARLDENLKVPSELVPRCPHCGRVMVPWVRDDAFLEGAAWIESAKRYQAFIDRMLERGRNALLLEIGVGDMTPGVIRLPFMALSQKRDFVRHAVVNVTGESSVSADGRRLRVAGDAGEVIAAIKNMRKGRA